MKKRERKYVNKAVVVLLILTISLSIVPIVSAATDYAITGMDILLEGSGTNATLTVDVHVNNPAISDMVNVELWLKDTNWDRVITVMATGSPVTLTYNWGGSVYDDGNSHAIKVVLNESDSNPINNVLETIIPISAFDEALGWYFSMQLWLDVALRNLPSPINWMATIPFIPIVIGVVVLAVAVLWWRARKKKNRRKIYRPPLPPDAYN